MPDQIQPLQDLEAFYQQEDPWGYRENPEDWKRRDIILGSIPTRNYQRALDVGCGEGFITHRLPANSITGCDLSENCIERARLIPENERCKFIACSLLDLPKHIAEPFDLVVITGLIYRQYFANSLTLVYDAVDRMLADDGILICSHIDDWYVARFPYLTLDYKLFSYREYTQRLEVYLK